MKNFIEQKTKSDQKVKISNARVYSNETCEIIFLFETRFKERRQSYDYSFHKQLKLKIQTLQRTDINKYRYIILIIQRHRHKINQLNNYADK